MRWNDIGDYHCSIAKTLSVVGDRWTLLLMREAFMRTRRFEDFQANTGASRAIVADRLRQLVDDGVLTKVAYQQNPERFEYRLTDKGLDFYPVMTALMTWGDRWMPLPEGAPVTLTHDCGHEFHPVMVCPHCGEPAAPSRVRARVSPTARAAWANARADRSRRVSVQRERDG
jgi:DNA-binding HxlR family transcriptional regulator